MMKQKSWHLDRREMLRGGGNSPSLSEQHELGQRTCGGRNAKRLLATYISYGVYHPKGKDGQNHEWSWYPRLNPGPDL